MNQKDESVNPNQKLKEYGEWLLHELEKQGVALSVVGENGLHIKGEITIGQKEQIRLWKRRLIEALSPQCSTCTSPMKLIEDGTLWFCPLGCQSRKNIQN